MDKCKVILNTVKLNRTEDLMNKENEMSRGELLSACIEMIMSLTDDEFALLKMRWERWKETLEDQSA